MIVCKEVRSCEREDPTYRERALRDAVICIGWMKLLSVICYMILFFLVHANSKGHMSTILRIMILTAVPPQILHGVLLFLGALELSVICYMILFFLVHANSKGHMSTILRIMILTAVPPQILHGVLLFLGALELSVICYMILFFLVHANSKGHMSTILRIMILTAVPPQILHGVLLFLGALELSVICYMILFFLVHANSKGHMSTILRIMILTAVPPQILHGVLLFLGALEEKVVALELSLWMCLLMASYNTILGVMGCIYFIRTGHQTMHFMVAVAFAVLALSLFTVLCHDILIIYSYKQTLLGNDPSPPAVPWRK